MEEVNLERISSVSPSGMVKTPRLSGEGGSVDVCAHLDEPEDLPEFLKETPVAGVLGIFLEIE